MLVSNPPNKNPTIIPLAAAIFTLAASGGVFGQCQWEPVGPPGITGPLQDPLTSIAVFDDGSGPAIYANSIFGSPTDSLAKWTGAEWVAGGGGLDAPAEQLIVFDDGSGPALYAGGKFTQTADGPASSLAKWDGRHWTPLSGGIESPPFTLEPYFNDMLVFDDGSGPALYVAGHFPIVDGVKSNSSIWRWNGSAWSAPGGGIYAAIHAMAIHDDGTGPALFIIGRYPDVQNRFLARLDGQAWSEIELPIGGIVESMVSHDDGSGPALFIGGSIPIGETPTWHTVLKWDGREAVPVGNSPVGTQFFLATALTLASSSGSGTNLLYAGGWFMYADGRRMPHIAVWDGESWSPLGEGTDGHVRCIAMLNDGSGEALYAAGAFGNAGGHEAARIARWDGANWSALGDGLGQNDHEAVVVTSLNSMNHKSGTKLLAGGFYLNAGDAFAIRHIAAWDGVSWSGLDDGFASIVYAMTEYDDGDPRGPSLIASGNFRFAEAPYSSHIARWDGAEWSRMGDGLYDVGRALGAYDEGNGDVLFASWYDSGEGQLLRWTGSTWIDAIKLLCSPSFYDAMIVFDDGTGPALYVGGRFTCYFVPSGTIRGVMRWDGSSWSAVGAGFSGTIVDLTVADADGDGDDDLIAVGELGSSDSKPMGFAAYWNGTTWQPLGDSVSPANFDDSDAWAICAWEHQSGRSASILVGGDFVSSTDPSRIHGVVRLNGDTWEPADPGMSDPSSTPTVYDLHVFDDGTGPALYAGGSFNSIGGEPISRIAALRCLPRHADLNGDGDVNELDLTILIQSWSIPPGSPGCDGAPGGCAADLNADGVVDGIDLGILLASWTI